MNSQWNRERKKEEYYKRAKKQDYRSRASFKLLQLNRKFNIIQRGDSVLDLGAAPGGWSQVALEAVGNDGLVVLVDLNKIKSFPEGNFRKVRGDFTKEDTIQEIERCLQCKAHVILSDASPQLTGIKDLDHLRMIDLAQSVMKICHEILRNNGKLIMKVFQGEDYPELLNYVKKYFMIVNTTKPPSSRKRSGEMYIVARGFKN